MFYNTPRLPRALLHILTVIKRTYVRGPGGQSKPVDETVTSFWGVVMPLSNLDWKQLPEGSYTQNSQKLDTYDGQQYTVKQELSHNSIHPMHRYLVEGVKKA